MATHFFFFLPIDTITCLKWHPSEPYLVSAGGRDRYIRVWHNIPGMKEQVKDLGTKLQKTTGEAMKVPMVAMEIVKWVEFK